MPRRERRVFRRSDGYEPLHFAESAKDHLWASKYLFETGNPVVFDSAGYLAHLSVELLLKAFLLDAKGEFGAEHSVVKLAKQVTRCVPKLTFDAQATATIRSLDRFQELRYPVPGNPVEVGSDDPQPILDLFNRLWQALPPEHRPKADPTGFVTKGGRILATKSKDA